MSEFDPFKNCKKRNEVKLKKNRTQFSSSVSSYENSNVPSDASPSIPSVASSSVSVFNGDDIHAFTSEEELNYIITECNSMISRNSPLDITELYYISRFLQSMKEMSTNTHLFIPFTIYQKILTFIETEDSNHPVWINSSCIVGVFSETNIEDIRIYYLAQKSEAKIKGEKPTYPRFINKQLFLTSSTLKNMITKSYEYTKKKQEVIQKRQEKETFEKKQNEKERLQKEIEKLQQQLSQL
jgi:hypothetical protein